MKKSSMNCCSGASAPKLILAIAAKVLGLFALVQAIYMQWNGMGTLWTVLGWYAASVILHVFGKHMKCTSGAMCQMK